MTMVRQKEALLISKELSEEREAGHPAFHGS
jgi:hypothetical protein